MALLKEATFGGSAGSHFKLRLEYTYTQDETNKKTTITYTEKMVSMDGYSGSGTANSITGYIGLSTSNLNKVGTASSIGVNSTITLGTWNDVVTHNADGTFPARTYAARIDCGWSSVTRAEVSGSFSAGAFPSFTTTFLIRYYANGGIDSPVSQHKTSGTAITLTTETPTKISTLGSPYTITFNGNNGTPDITSMTSNLITNYNFSKWNTNAAGTGTNYNSGVSYSTDADLVLYAQYTTGTTQRESVILPGASRTGYRCLGWGTSASATTPVSSPYTPSGNVTLYAIWESINDKIKTKDGSTWVSTPVVKVKNGDNWDYISNYIKTSW